MPGRQVVWQTGEAKRPDPETLNGAHIKPGPCSPAISIGTDGRESPPPQPSMAFCYNPIRVGGSSGRGARAHVPGHKHITVMHVGRGTPPMTKRSTWAAPTHSISKPSALSIGRWGVPE